MLLLVMISEGQKAQLGYKTTCHTHFSAFLMPKPLLVTERS